MYNRLPLSKPTPPPPNWSNSCRNTKKAIWRNPVVGKIPAEIENLGGKQEEIPQKIRREIPEKKNLD